MADIWSSIGVDIKQDEGEWLYRLGTDTHGPLAQRLVVEKLLKGEITIDTPVAREGTEFHPINSVKAFAPYLAQEASMRAKRERQHRYKVLGSSLVSVLALIVVAVFFGHREYRHRLRVQQEAARKLALIKPKAPPPPPVAPHLGLVALVSLGTEADVRIHGQSPKKKRAKRAPTGVRGSARRAQEEAAEEEEVQSCKLSQKEILTTLMGALGKINVCVEDEKKRDEQKLLPPTLSLEFVVRPSGKVTEFAVDDRHYRTGPMNNCLTKVFNTVTFPLTDGANCPISIPIKIGK